MYAYHHFVNHTPERAGRVYTLWLQQDLFGYWTLVRVAGGRQREPVLHSQLVESREAGERLVAALVRVRLRHGYEQTDSRAQSSRTGKSDIQPLTAQQA
jgi:hypothetical protein